MCKNKVRSTFSRHLKKLSIQIHWKEVCNGNVESHKCRKKSEGCAIVDHLRVNDLESKLKSLPSTDNASSANTSPANESVPNDFAVSMNDFNPLPISNQVDDFTGIGQPNAFPVVGHGLDNISTSGFILGTRTDVHNPHQQSYQNQKISAIINKQDFENDSNSVSTSFSALHLSKDEKNDEKMKTQRKISVTLLKRNLTR